MADVRITPRHAPGDLAPTGPARAPARPGPGPGLDLCLLIDRSVVESFVDHDRTVQTRVTIGRNAGPWAMLLSDPDRPVMVAATSITWVPAADAPAL
jgi:hypothetical protein